MNWNKHKVVNSVCKDGDAPEDAGPIVTTQLKVSGTAGDKLDNITDFSCCYYYY